MLRSRRIPLSLVLLVPLLLPAGCSQMMESYDVGTAMRYYDHLNPKAGLHLVQSQTPAIETPLVGNGRPFALSSLVSPPPEPIARAQVSPRQTPAPVERPAPPDMRSSGNGTHGQLPPIDEREYQ